MTDEQAKTIEKNEALSDTSKEVKYFSPAGTIEEIVEKVRSYHAYIQEMNIKKGVSMDDPKIVLFLEFLDAVIDPVTARMLSEKEDLITKFMNDGWTVLPEFCDPIKINEWFEKYSSIGFKLQYVDPTLLAVYVNRDVVPIVAANYTLMQFLLAKTLLVLHDYMIDPPQEELKSKLIIDA